MISLTVLVLGVATILGVSVLALFPGSRVLVKGCVNLFIENKAKTPEGAAAIYTEAIAIQQEKYNKASNLYSQLAGKQESLKTKISSLQLEIKETEQKCEIFINNNKDEQAEIYAQVRNEKILELQTCWTQLDQLTERVQDAQQITAQCEKTLRELKHRKNQDVAQLELDTQLAETYDTLDELKRTSTTDKLLGIVKEGVQDKHEKAIGAKIVHNNRISTKQARADESFNQLAGDDYLTQLKKKRETKALADTSTVKTLDLNVKSATKETILRK